MSNILLLERLRNIKEEAIHSPEAYKRDAHKYLEEFMPVIEAHLTTPIAVKAAEPIVFPKKQKPEIKKKLKKK